MTEVTVIEMLFSDAATLATHTEEALHRLIDVFAKSFAYFGLTVSLKNTNSIGRVPATYFFITIGYYTLYVVDNFTVLGLTIIRNLSIYTEL